MHMRPIRTTAPQREVLKKLRYFLRTGGYAIFPLRINYRRSQHDFLAANGIRSLIVRPGRNGVVDLVPIEHPTIHRRLVRELRRCFSLPRYRVNRPRLRLARQFKPKRFRGSWRDLVAHSARNEIFLVEREEFIARRDTAMEASLGRP